MQSGVTSPAAATASIFATASAVIAGRGAMPVTIPPGCGVSGATVGGLAMSCPESGFAVAREGGVR